MMESPNSLHLLEYAAEIRLSSRKYHSAYTKAEANGVLYNTYGEDVMLEKQAIKRIPILQCGDLVIDPQCRTVTLSEIEISLYPKEFEVLFLLAQHPAWVLTSKQVYESVWQEEWWGCKHIISNTVCQLRRKLGRSNLIQTVVGYGYKPED